MIGVTVGYTPGMPIGYDIGGADMAIMEPDNVGPQIKEWMIASGYSLQEIPDSEFLSHFRIRDSENRIIDVARPLNHSDNIVIGQKLRLTQAVTAELEAMEDRRRVKLIWDLRFGLLHLGVGFHGVTLPMSEITVETRIWLDALTKNAFMHQALLLRRALALIQWTFHREFSDEPSAQEPSAFGFRP